MEVKAAARPIPLVGQLARLPVQLVELARSGSGKRSVGPQPPSIRLFSKGGLRAALSFSDFGGRCVFWTHSQDRAFLRRGQRPDREGRRVLPRAGGNRGDDRRGSGGRAGAGCGSAGRDHRVGLIQSTSVSAWRCYEPRRSPARRFEPAEIDRSGRSRDLGPRV